MDTQKLQLALSQLLAANRTLLPVIEAVAELVLEAARQAQSEVSGSSPERVIEEVPPVVVPPLSREELEDMVSQWGGTRVEVAELADSAPVPVLPPRKLSAEHRTELRSLCEGMQHRQELLTAVLERRKLPSQLPQHWISDLFPGKDLRPYQQLYQAQAVVLMASELVLQSTPAEVGNLRDLLEPLVEAQSMLRAASFRFVNRDEEQYQYFQLLKRITGDLGIYFERYMKVNDIADLVALPALQRRLEKLLVPYRERELLRQLRENPEASVEQVEAWLVQLEALGVPPQDERIGTILSGRGYPEPLPLLAEALLALQEEEAIEGEVLSLASPLLHGRRVCVIGGEPNPASIARLEEALGCSVHWIEWEGHLSIGRLELEVQGSDLVLLLIRWIAHSYGDISHFCKEHDIPLVRLPAGYGVNRVLFEVERQVGKRLTALAG